jgi:hypothetical protein
MRIFCFFALIFLLSNCTTSVSYERVIQNDSSYDIWIINPNVSDNCPVFFQDSILVFSNTSQVLEFTTENNGDVSDFSDCPSVCLDNLGSRINNHDSLSLAVSLQATSNNWLYALQPGESGSCECELTITDAGIN